MVEDLFVEIQGEDQSVEIRGEQIEIQGEILEEIQGLGREELDVEDPFVEIQGEI